MAETAPTYDAVTQATSDYPSQRQDFGTSDREQATPNMSHEERQTAHAAARFGYGPLAHMRTYQSNDNNSVLHPAFAGEFQPGLYRGVQNRTLGNPAPLGLAAFALTTFILSLINVGTRELTAPNIVVALAFGYGGLIQLLAGMWEMAVGNTFGATALSSYGGFWISFAIILTPGGFAIQSSIIAADGVEGFYSSFGLYLFGWFIFTFLLLICTVKSTLVFFLLFFTVTMTFLLLACGYIHLVDGAPDPSLVRAGGAFGLAAAFLAWYSVLAGVADTSNSFFIMPVIHFPWSEKGRERRGTLAVDQDKEA